MNAHIDLDQRALADFCRRNRIRRLSVFGSALRDDFRPDSDVDFLVEFEPEARVSLLDLIGMEIELGQIVGREVDLRTPLELSPLFRDRVVAEAEVQYAAG
jgi:predicted nucleotidyltransferase